MSEGDNNFGIVVSVDASGSTDGARTFQRSAQDIANSANQASSSTKNLNTELKNVGGSEVKEALESIAGSLELLNRALVALGIGAVVIEFRELFDVGKELEDELIHLQVASGQGADGMKELEESAISLSNAFGQSQIKVVAAQITAAKAGFSELNDNTKVTTASLELAKIGFSDAGTAAKTLTEVMQAYGVSADGARSVSESLFVATQKGNLDLGQLGQVFERIAPSAQAAGLSINQVLATLRGLGTVESPQRAVLGITQLLKDIAEPSKTAQEAFDRISASLQRIGVNALTFKDLVSQQGFVGALKSINEVAGGSQEALSKAFGNPQAGITAFALLNQASKAYGDTLEELTKKEETAAAASQKITDSTSYQAEQFRQRVQNSFIGLAGQALESLTPLFRFLNSNFDTLTVAAEALAAVLATRLIVSAVATVSAFIAARIEAGALAISTGVVATESTLAAVGLEGMGAAAAEVSAAEALAAEATGTLGLAIDALGGPITLVLGLLAAAYIAMNHYGDSAENARKSNKNLQDDLERLGKTKAKAPDSLAIDDAGELTQQRDNLAKQIANQEAIKKQAGGISAGLTTTDESGGTVATIGFSADEERKLLADKKQLDDLNASLDQFNTLKTYGGTDPLVFGGGAPDKVVDPTKAIPQGATDPAVAGQEALQEVYKKTFDTVNQVAKATAALHLIQNTPAGADGIKQVGGTPLNNQGQILAEQSLRAEIVAGTDALTKNQRALATLEAINDPIAAATNKYANELRNLNNQQTIAGGSTAAYSSALADLKLKYSESLVAANAKVAGDRAATDADKALVQVTSTQSQRQLELADALSRGKITADVFYAAMEDGSFKIQKAVIATEALTAGQSKLALATLATSEAQSKADAAGLTGDARTKFLAESKVAQDDAARSTDTLADRVSALAGQYDPLVAIQKKYADQLDTINSLQRARPDLAPQLETAKTLQPLQQKQEVDKTLSLPAADKSATLANDQYDITIQKINNDLSLNRITQDQANQAILEAKEALNASSQAFDNFAKAGVEAGKAIGDAFTEFLIKPTEGLRGLLDQVAKGLQASAAGIVSKQIQGAAYSSLANSSNPTLSKLGTNLASGAGVQLTAPKLPAGLDTSKDLAKLTADGSDLQKGALAATAPDLNLDNVSDKIADNELKPIETTATKLGDEGVSSVASDAKSLGSEAGSSALDSAGTELTTAGTTLDSAGTALNSAASALSSAASALQEGGGGLGDDADDLGGDDSGGGDSLGGIADDLFSSEADDGFALGGSAKPGQSFMVGERGPEVVTAGQHGASIAPNDQVRQAVGAAAGNSKSTVVPAPNVNVPVQIVNVSDPNDVPAAMNGPAGQQAISNYISQNRGTVKSLLGA